LLTADCSLLIAYCLTQNAPNAPQKENNFKDRLITFGTDVLGGKNSLPIDFR